MVFPFAKKVENLQQGQCTPPHWTNKRSCWWVTYCGLVQCLNLARKFFHKTGKNLAATSSSRLSLRCSWTACWSMVLKTFQVTILVYIPSHCLDPTSLFLYEDKSIQKYGSTICSWHNSPKIKSFIRMRRAAVCRQNGEVQHCSLAQRWVKISKRETLQKWYHCCCKQLDHYRPPHVHESQKT